MPEIPVDTPRGYIGVFMLIMGVFLFLAGTGIIKIQQVTVKEGTKTWGFGLTIALIGFLFLWPDVAISPMTATDQSATQNSLTLTPTTLQVTGINASATVLISTDITIIPTQILTPSQIIASVTPQMNTPTFPTRIITETATIETALSPTTQATTTIPSSVVILTLPDLVSSNFYGTTNEAQQTANVSFDGEKLVISSLWDNRVYLGQDLPRNFRLTIKYITTEPDNQFNVGLGTGDNNIRPAFVFTMDKHDTAFEKWLDQITDFVRPIYTTTNYSISPGTQRLVVLERKTDTIAISLDGVPLFRPIRDQDIHRLNRLFFTSPLDRDGGYVGTIQIEEFVLEDLID